MTIIISGQVLVAAFNKEVALYMWTSLVVCTLRTFSPWPIASSLSVFTATSLYCNRLIIIINWSIREPPFANENMLSSIGTSPI